MKKIISFIFAILCCSSIIAQKLIVCEFNHLSDDVSATIEQIKDYNGEPCALIKVWTPATNPSFDGPVLKVIDKGGEYWVYVTAETSYLTIKSKDYPPVRAEFQSVQSLKTYELLCCKDEQRPLRHGLTPKWKAGISPSTKQILQRLIDNMVEVKGGTFTMGATSEKDDYYSRAKPAHQVTLSDYYISKYELTQEEWETVMGNNPSNYKGDNKPVEQVSWNDCQNFIKKLNELTGLIFRLPTEAEWEYAARGGNKSRGYKYSGSNSIDDVAWYSGNSSSTSHPIGTKHANELGLYDMSGNVNEWCSDWYGRYNSLLQTNPTGPITGSYRVHRGGSMHCHVSNFEVWCRFLYIFGPDVRYLDIGMRLACSL